MQSTVNHEFTRRCLAIVVARKLRSHDVLLASPTSSSLMGRRSTFALTMGLSSWLATYANGLAASA